MSDARPESAGDALQACADAFGAISRRCRYCGTNFAPRRPWAVFCGPRCRRLWHARGASAIDEAWRADVERRLAALESAFVQRSA